MKRLTRTSGTRLIILALGIGSLAVLAFILWASRPASASQLDSSARVGLVAPPPVLAAMPNAETTPPPPISCNVSITTSDYVIASQNIAVPSNVGNLTKLGLVANPAVLGSQTTLINYFQLYPAVVGTEYTLDALPTIGTNYDLGIYVYVSPGSGQYNDVYTQLDFTDKAATATFVATSSGPYIFAVFQKSIGCDGGTYYLQFTSTPATPTPTSTPTATGSPTPTPTATPGWTLPDQYDVAPNNNDTITNAVALGATTTTGLTLYNATLYPSDPGNDQDWYIIYGSASYQYSVSAAPDSGFVYPYMLMQIFGPDKVTLVGQVTGSNSPSINWTANSTGSYYVHIARSSGSPTSGTYHVTWTSNAPTVTPTSTPSTGTPTDTPVPGIDAFEPNFDFDHAAGIGLNVKYTNINFVPLPGQSVNNDFFRVRVKTGMLVTCETLDLSAGTDTNMILYDNNEQGLAGNDDVDRARGELRSRVTVSINYDGFLYILVGQGYAVPNSQAAQYTYSLQCTVGAGSVTATPTPPPGATAAPPAPVSTHTPPIPTEPPPSATLPPTPMPPISVRALPTPTPTGPVQQMVTADLQVYYDANDNSVADPGEGVVGLPARVYDATTGALLAQGFTDVAGHAVFSVPAVGPVRVVVPYLNFEAIVPPSGATIPVLISPRELPEQIP